MEKIRFHNLRHTFITLALPNGVDVKTLPGLLGHYSAGFTLGPYLHTDAAGCGSEGGRIPVDEYAMTLRR